MEPSENGIVPPANGLESTDDKDAEENTLESNSFEESLNEEVLRGDAIGDTLFSGSFVLRTLLKLLSFEVDLANDEEFEQHLCQVWDMTTNSDVILYLHKSQAIQILHEALVTAFDDRLTEIIVGILGNMCIEEVVCKDILGDQIILEFMFFLCSTRDTETLIQLFRMISCLMIKAEEHHQIDALHQTINKTGFYGNLQEILSNSTNPNLLKEALRTLNALSKSYINYDQEMVNRRVAESFTNELMKETLLNSTIEAINVIIDTKDCLADALNFFFNIHHNLISFDDFNGFYKGFENLFETINIIFSVPINEDHLAIMEELLQTNIECFWPELLMEYLESFHIYSQKLEKDDDFDKIDENLNVGILAFIKKFSLKQLNLSNDNELKLALSKTSRRKENLDYFLAKC